MTRNTPAWDPAADALRAVGPLAQSRGIALGHDAHAALDARVATDRDGLAQLLAMVLSRALLDAKPGAEVGLVAARSASERLCFEIRGAARLGPHATLGRLAGRLGVTVHDGPPPKVEVELAATAPSTMRFLPGDAGSVVDTERAVVLCIDDNMANARLVVGVLRQRPHVEALFAHDGGSGVRIAQDRRPNLILLDLHLPDLAGKAVLAVLRASPVTAETPIVVVSADALPGREDELLSAGADAFLAKPVDVAELLATVDRLLAR